MADPSKMLFGTALAQSRVSGEGWIFKRENTALATSRIMASCGCGEAARKESSGNMILSNESRRISGF